MNKVYTVVLEWSTDDATGIEIEVFSAYEKAVNRFNEIIIEEHNPKISWVNDAWDENGDLLENYDIDCNEPFTDGEEHELWWNIDCNDNWYLHDHLELRILEVK